MEHTKKWYIHTEDCQKIYVGEAPDVQTLMTTLNRRDVLSGQAFIMYSEGAGWFFWPEGSEAFNAGAGGQYRGVLKSENDAPPSS